MDTLTFERSVVGAVLSNNATFWRLPQITEDDFSDDDCRYLFTKIKHLLENDKTVDCFLLAKETEYEVADLVEMVTETISVENAPLYAQQVMKDAQVRRARELYLKHMENFDVSAVINDLAQLSRPMAENYDFNTLYEKANNTLEEEEKRYNGALVKGIPTTLPSLDIALRGFHGPQMYVLGGRPGRFKSVFALQVLLMAGKPCGIFSLEMGDLEIFRRVRARGVPTTANLKIYFDTSSYTMDEIQRRAMAWKSQHDIQFLVIDHIQLVAHKARNRFEGLAEISRRVKMMCIQMDMPILVLSQIAREVERERRFPRLSDLRECGNLEQDADVVMFIHAVPGEMDDDYFMQVVKNRNGISGSPFAIQTFGEKAAISE